MRALDDLRLFDHLSRSRHFGRTAAECHVSPSSLSRAIARLEADAGVRLFERDSRSVSLSPEGVRFGAFVTDVLAGWARYEDGSFEQSPELTGTVALFCTVTASQTIVPQMLARFRSTYPGIDLALETGYAAEALERLETGSVDVTVAPLPARVPRHLLAHVIATTSLVFVAPISTAEGLAPRLADGWPDLPLVLPSSGLSRTLIARWFRRLRVRPTIAAEAAGHEAVLSLVGLGCGVGVVPELVARQSVSAGDLEVIGFDPPLPAFDIAACTTADRLRRRPVAALWASLTAGSG